MINYALRLVGFGLWVFPIQYGTKDQPLTKHGCKDASNDPEQIKKWWAYWPNANIGIAVGEKYGMIGLDVDCNHGATIEMIEPYLPTVVTKTLNGYHVFFKFTHRLKNAQVLEKGEPGADGKAVACVTVRSTGYYFVAPYSERTDVDPPFVYEALKHPGYDDGLSFEYPELLAEFPEPILREIEAKRASKSKTKTNSSAKTPSGLRHDLFKRTAIAMRKQGKSREEIIERLTERNLKDCNPPKTKEEFEKDVIHLVDKWVIDKIDPVVGDDEYIIPIGHDGSDYYYTSSSNGQIVRFSRSAHNCPNLFDLMPLSYWQKVYGDEDGKISWVLVASDLMDSCRDAGVSHFERLRGVGCWRENKELVIHLGDRLWHGGVEKGLKELDSQSIFTLSRRIKEINFDEMTTDGAKQLFEACNAFSWKDKSSGILLLGSLALLRICGALPWRPHVWVTGPKGSGKSTLLSHIIQPVAGEMSLYASGETTAAGIRQALGAKSLPVIFDEAETTNKKSANRIQSVLELIRQASSESTAQIYKGTPDGKVMAFKIQSMFLLASIRVNLVEDADISRFTLLELIPAPKDGVREFRNKVFNLPRGVGDQLFARMVKNFDLLLKNFEVFQEVIAKESSQRDGDQLGMLLAGYWTAVSDGQVHERQAMGLAGRFMGLKAGEITAASDELECLYRLLDSAIEMRTDVKCERMSVQSMLADARTLPDVVRPHLWEYGMDLTDEGLFVLNSHPMLSRVYDGTRWENMWHRALTRLSGAVAKKHRVGARSCTSPRHGTLVPKSVIYNSEVTVLPVSRIF